MRPHHTDPTLEVRHLVQNRGVSFDIKFSRAIISDLIQKLNLITLRKATFIGTILPINDGDWILSGRLGASVDQACSLTLVPVRTRIELPVIRNFRKSFLELPETELETLSLNEDNELLVHLLIVHVLESVVELVSEELCVWEHDMTGCTMIREEKEQV